MNFPGRASRRALTLAAIAVLLLAAGAFAWSARDRSASLSPRPQSEKPVLLLVTSLPLIFGEQFSLEAHGSEALDALETRYRVQPIGVTDAGSLRQARLLLMAHPMAQPAEALVDLDRWVRSGGRLLLLADPILQWPSSRPLGDPLRPPPGFADTGLLKHWGLTLAAPADLRSTNPSCTVTSDGLVARCAIGAGEATVIADADFLNVEATGQSDRLELLIEELERLER